MVGPMTMNADEINCLIHAYLRDSGFDHTAFTLHNEAQLDASFNFKKIIPRGELAELLGKALLYTEVEKHYAGNNAMKTNCTAPFSLLEEHQCNMDPSLEPTATLASAMEVGAVKRKAGDAVDASHAAKKARAAPSSNTANGSDATTRAVETTPKVPTKPRQTEPNLKSLSFSPGVTGPLREEIQVIPCQTKTELFCAAIHPQDPEIISAGDGYVNIKRVPGTGPALDPSNDKAIQLAGDVDGDITSMDWSPDGRLLSIACFDHKVRVITSDAKLYLESSAHSGSVFASKFSGDGKWLISAGLDCTTCVWNIPEKKLYKQVRHGGCCLDLEWVGADLFAVCCSDNVVHVMHVDGNAPYASLIGHTSEVNSIKYNLLTNRLASCSDDSTARIWSLNNLGADKATQPPSRVTESIVFKGHAAPVNNLGWAGPSDAEVLVTSSFDTTSRMWDASTGACLKIFSDHVKPVFSIGVSPDRNFFATGGSDGWLHVYNIPRFERVWSWRHQDPSGHGVFDVTWRRDEAGKLNRFALALESGEIVVMNVNLIGQLHT